MLTEFLLCWFSLKWREGVLRFAREDQWNCTASYGFNFRMRRHSGTIAHDGRMHHNYMI